MMSPSAVGICDLPNEVLCEIFSKLPPEVVLKCVINVCTRWNAVVKGNRIFWDYIQLTVHCDYFINHSFLGDSFSSDQFLKNTYSNEKHIFIGEKDLDKISSLRCIKFTEGSKAKSTPALLLCRILDVISRICKNIEKVEFVRCFGATSSLFFQLLRERYSSLSEVRFGANCTYIIPYHEVSKFTNISTLVSHDYRLKRSDLYLLADGCETLCRLWILNSRSPKVDDMLYFLEKKKHVLKELGLGMNLQDCIIDKIRECHHLEVLFAADTRYISNACMVEFNNLPSLKYCSLHRATFDIEILWGMILSGISSQLVVLDMTDYIHEREFKTSILQKDKKYMNMWKEPKFVTFTNHLNTALIHPWYVKSPWHWMYHSKTVQEEMVTWKKTWDQS